MSSRNCELRYEATGRSRLLFLKGGGEVFQTNVPFLCVLILVLWAGSM